MSIPTIQEASKVFSSLYSDSTLISIDRFQTGLFHWVYDIKSKGKDGQDQVIVLRMTPASNKKVGSYKFLKKLYE
jgi:hypothetical protein